MKAITSSEKVLQSAITMVVLSVCVVLMNSPSSAQTGRVPTPARTDYRASSAASARAAIPRAKNCLGLSTSTSYDFGTVPLGLIGFQVIPVKSLEKITSVDIKDSNGADPSPLYKYELGDKNCDSKTSEDKTPCVVVVGFMPSDDHSVVSATVTISLADGTSPKPYTVTGRGSAAACLSAKSKFFPLNRGLTFAKSEDATNSVDYPLLPTDVSAEAADRLNQDFGGPLKKLLVNCFYTTNGLFSDFNQFQSIYNAASGSTTINAQLGSLNFTNGMQITVGTNPQVGSSPSSSNAASAAFRSFRSSAAAAASGSSIPTLSAAATAQAAQNITNGGTVYAVDLFPVFLKSSTYSLATLSTAVREGVDFQKFNNTSITASNPSTHTFVGLEGYFQLTSSNNAANSSNPAGSIFLGGSYGYSLMNHRYSVQNGFGRRINSQIAQVSAGILLNGVAKIAVYRGFGPSQQYIDSTSMVQKTANNFQTWSIAIAYQKSGSGKSQ
jgi:hypothetical protein